jgi:hypothetical protein
VESKLRKSILHHFVLLSGYCLLTCFASLAVSDSVEKDLTETVQFKTFEAWSSPRLYYFFRIADDLESVSSLPDSKNVSIKIPFQKMNDFCQDRLEHRSLRIITRPEQEVLLSSDRRWIALRVAENKSSSLPDLQDIHLEFYSSACVLRLSWNTLSASARERLIPRIVFSEAEHHFSGQNFRVREDFLVSSVRYRVEAASTLRRITVPDASVWMPMLDARASLWSNRLGYLGVDFGIRQSMSSFPRVLVNSEWNFALISHFHWHALGWAWILKPHIGLRQQLLLNEAELPIPQGSRSISMFQVGASLDMEFARRWLLRSRAELGFKEFEKIASSSNDWAYVLLEGALGYRLTSELRFLGEAGFQRYSRKSESIQKLNVMRLGIEMDF